MASGSFFKVAGYSPTTIDSIGVIVDQAINDAGAIGPKSITVLRPTFPSTVTLFYVNAESTIEQITTNVTGTTPTVSFSIRYAASRASVGTEVITGGSTVSSGGTVITTFNSATIPANSWVWLAMTASTGTVDEFSVSIDF